MKKLLYLLVVFLAVQGCKDQECPVEPDPCSEYPNNIKLTTLLLNRSFCPLSKDAVWNEYSEYTLDTFIEGSRILFELNYSYDSVRWQIGNDPRVRNEKRILSDFYDFTGNVVIRAVAYRKINIECFGVADDGIDSIYRTINIQSLYDSPVFGKFRGVEIGTTDSFNFTIGIDTFISDFDPDEEYYETYYQGLPKGSVLKQKFGMTWKGIFGINNPAARSLDGLALCYTHAYLENKNRNELTVHFRMKDTEDTPRSFKGKRIN